MTGSWDDTPREAALRERAGMPLPQIDLWTVGAIAVVAYVATVFVHEAVGHGGASLLLGARIVLLTTVSLRCEGENLTAWDHRIISAGGTVANLFVGVAALCVFHRARRALAANRYFLWLFGHVNLFTAGGYPMALAFAGFGDWDAFTRGLPHRVAWQVGVTLLGAVVSFAALGHARRSLQPFLGRDETVRWRRAVALTVVPYLIGGTVNTIAGVYNPEGARLIVLSAMAGTFGGTAFLAWLPKFVGRPRADTPEAPATPQRRRAWLGAAAAALAIHWIVLAPGVPR